MASARVSRYLKQPYARVIMPDETGRYAAQILEFPGCFAEGDSPEEAYDNLQEAAESWIESALAQRMPVPPPFASQGYSGTVSLRLPKSLHKRAAEFAHRDGVSLNQFLVAAIAARVGTEDLLNVVASKLDDRLDALQTRPFLFLGMGQEIVSSGRPMPQPFDVDFSQLQESTTSPSFQKRTLVHPKER